MKKAAIFISILLNLSFALAQERIPVKCLAGVKARTTSINRQANQIIAEVEAKDRYQAVRFGEANLGESTLAAQSGAKAILDVVKDIKANKPITNDTEISLIKQLCDYRFNVEATVY